MRSYCVRASNEDRSRSTLDILHSHLIRQSLLLVLCVLLEKIVRKRRVGCPMVLEVVSPLKASNAQDNSQILS